jgi:signal transduction histidine kinase
VKSTDAQVARVERALFEAVMDQRQLGVGVCGADGVLTMMNPALEDYLGQVYSPTVEPAWARCYHLHDAAGAPLPSGADPLARALRGEQVVDQVVAVQRPDQPVRWMRCNGLQLHDEDAAVIGAAVFVVDVTPRVTEQRRLDDLRARLVETVNHEVRTPVAAITGQLELLEELVPPLPETAQWSLGVMKRATARLGEVVDTISELAEQSQKRRPPDDADRR